MPERILGPVLGIETSCDETAAAVVAADGSILSNVVFSQLDEHRPYGGVVPEIAARAHIHHLNDLISRAMDEAGLSFGELAGVATTSGPGLIGGVMVGLMSAKAIASVHNKPFMAINHLEGHALTARLTGDVSFPYLLLLVSGGHCQLLIVKGVGKYQRLGTTIDDAVGEAYDKTAKKLGLGYPGGPAVEAAAKTGDPTRFDLPRPLIRRADCHFSFSGLKTAVSRAVDALPATPNEQDEADICVDWFFEAIDGPNKMGADHDQQGGAGDDRPRHPGRDAGDAGWENTASVKGSTSWEGESPSLVIAGGVAANQYLRTRLSAICAEKGFTLACPPIALCTDNAAMVAWAGVERLALGLTDTLDTPARARWPLDPDAPAAIGAGVKA